MRESCKEGLKLFGWPLYLNHDSTAIVQDKSPNPIPLCQCVHEGAKANPLHNPAHVDVPACLIRHMDLSQSPEHAYGGRVCALNLADTLASSPMTTL